MTDLERKFVAGEGWQTVESGGSQPIDVVSFDFAFDTPGLNDGVEVAGYTPAVGDRVWDAWIFITEVWNGTTPKGEIGQFTGGSEGWFSEIGVAVDMKIGEDSVNGDASEATYGWYLSRLAQTASQTAGGWTPPFTLRSTDPLKICVSRNGHAGGLDPGASQGAAKLSLLIVPAAKFL